MDYVNILYGRMNDFTAAYIGRKYKKTLVNSKC